MDAAPSAKPGPSKVDVAAVLWPAPVQFSLLALACALLLGFTFLGLPENVTPAPTPQPLLLDINSANQAELQLLPGVGDKLARTILEHRARHGPFLKLDDLKKVPGIGKLTWQRIKGHVAIRTPEHEPNSTLDKKSAAKPRAWNFETIAINEAGPEELEKLPGIGKVLAARIVEVRKEKGPFKDLDALKQVRGVGVKTRAKIKPFVKF